MPQNAVIAATGGDYTTLKAWHDAEKNSNYGGAPTRCYISGIVLAGGVVGFRIAANMDWPNGLEILAMPGQEYNGTNHLTCARLTGTNSIADIGDVDFYTHGVAYMLTNGYNAEPLKTNSAKVKTARRLFKVHNTYLESSPYYHGASNAFEITMGGNGANEYKLDIKNVIINPRASQKGFHITASNLYETYQGTIDGITLLPTNSGTSVDYGVRIVGGALCNNLEIKNIVSLGSEVRKTYLDYDKDPTFGGTISRIATANGSGNITGVTTTSELMDYANGDYRAKPTGTGYGAFLQGATPPAATSNIRAYIGGQFVSGKIKVRQNNAWVNAVARV